MKIAFVTHQYPPQFVTGTELYAHRLARKYRSEFGHDVNVFTYEPTFQEPYAFVRKEETVHEDIPVTRVAVWPGLAANPSLGSYYHVHTGKIFGEFLDHVRPDVIHVFHLAFLGASLLEEARLRGIPVVVNLMDFWFLCPTIQLLKTMTLEPCQGPDPFECLECLSRNDATYQHLTRFTQTEGFDPLLPDGNDPGDGRHLNQPGPDASLTALAVRKEFLREILQQVDRIVAPSNTMRDIFCRAGYDEEKIDVVRYGVDAEFAPVERKPSSTLRLGFIGSLNEPKGPHVLVGAVMATEGDLTLDLYGDQTMFPAYSQALLERTTTDPRIRVQGRLEPHEVPQVLSGLDALVIPSLWRENTPFVVLEAQAAGVPVIASSVDGIAEIVTDGEDGRLFTPGSDEELAQVLKELLEDREALVRMAGNTGGTRSLLDNARDFDGMYRAMVAVGGSGSGDNGQKNAGDG